MCQQPHFRRKYLEDDRFGWSLTVHTVGTWPVHSNDTGHLGIHEMALVLSFNTVDVGLGYFLYALTKHSAQRSPAAPADEAAAAVSC